MTTDRADDYHPARVIALVDGDVPIARRLLRRFLDDVPVAWNAIEDAVASGRPEAVAQTTHHLRGSLALVEGDELAERIGSWERDASTGPAITPAQLRATFTGLSDLVARVRRFVEAPDADASDGACS